MTALLVQLEAQRCVFVVDGHQVHKPVGPARLTDTELVSDPPRAEELTNAIGAVVDHLDDVLRELPGATDVEQVLIHGAEAEAIAAVEVGAPADLPFELSRDAAEDVFRTLATERRSDRAHNPGLAAECVETVVGGCCVVVGVMRKLQLAAITVVAQPPVNGKVPGR